MSNLSKAHTSNRQSPHVAHGDDPRFFSHPRDYEARPEHSDRGPRAWAKRSFAVYATGWNGSDREGRSSGIDIQG
jgi:hypothetical protein